MASNLSDNEESLWWSMVGVLTDYTHSPLTQSRSKYLEAAANGVTGGTYSHLYISYNGLLAIIASEVTGSTVSQFTSSGLELMAMIVNNPPGGGNTAPHDMTYFNATDNAVGATGTVEVGGGGAVVGDDHVMSIGATDDEDNPLFVSLPDDAGGIVGLFNADTEQYEASVPVAFAKVRVIQDIEIEDDPVVYTVRVSDSGGLYVEQEFTITVMTA